MRSFWGRPPDQGQGMGQTRPRLNTARGHLAAGAEKPAKVLGAFSSSASSSVAGSEPHAAPSVSNADRLLQAATSARGALCKMSELLTGQWDAFMKKAPKLKGLKANRAPADPAVQRKRMDAKLKRESRRPTVAPVDYR